MYHTLPQRWSFSPTFNRLSLAHLCFILLNWKRVSSRRAFHMVFKESLNLNIYNIIEKNLPFLFLFSACKSHITQSSWHKIHSNISFSINGQPSLSLSKHFSRQIYHRIYASLHDQSFHTPDLLQQRKCSWFFSVWAEIKNLCKCIFK